MYTFSLSFADTPTEMAYVASNGEQLAFMMVRSTSIMIVMYVCCCCFWLLVIPPETVATDAWYHCIVFAFLILPNVVCRQRWLMLRIGFLALEWLAVFQVLGLLFLCLLLNHLLFLHHRLLICPSLFCFHLLTQ